MSITLRIRYFAALREVTGREHEDIVLATPATIASMRHELTTRYPALAAVLPRCLAARNRGYADDATTLTDGDELVFIPPMAGGN